MFHWLFARRRRWQRYREARHGLLRLALWLGSVLAAHTSAMMVLEGMSVADALWLTATTATTVGYGDLSAKTNAGRLATVILMYGGAIFILAKTVNDWFDLKTAKAERKRRGSWDWNMRDHLLVIGQPCNGEGRQSLERAVDFFERLAIQIHASPQWMDTPIQIFTPVFADTGLPPRLSEQGIVHYGGTPTTRGALSAVHADHARAIIVLADSEIDSASDAMTFDTVDRLRRSGSTAPIIAECVDSNNADRLRAAGASSVVRPMRGYPEMLSRAVVAPGAEVLISDLFTAEGDECTRIDLPQPWRGAWRDLCRTLIDAGIGTPIGYADGNGKVHANPVNSGDVHACALFVIINDARESELARIPALLGRG